MTQFIRIILLTLLCASPTLGFSTEAFDAPDMAFGTEWHQEGKSAYLCCESQTVEKENARAHYTFGIYAEKPEHPLCKRIGSLSASYTHENCEGGPTQGRVSIDKLEIMPRFRRKGHGASALEILLTTFRSPAYNTTGISHFWLMVQASQLYAPARSLYTKLGFKVQKDDSIHWEMTLPR